MINFANNLEDLAEEIGKWRGMAEGIDQPEYMDSLITRAFEVADQKFNMSAALSADDFDFSHMYEYGTRGVGTYTGESGTLDPMSQTSRLWRSFLVGGGGKKMITFEFRSAVQPNPPKTPENTGIDSDAFEPDRLQVNQGKEYIWRQKAETVENNKTVMIRVQGAKALFVPLNQGINNPTERERERGFAFRKAIASRPGQWTGGAGQFTAFFAGWWAEQGAVELESEMLEEFNRDVADFQRKNPPAKSALKPSAAVNIKGVAEAKRRKTMKQWQISARDAMGRVKVL